MKVQVTSITQTANELLGTKEKTLHYLIIGEGDDKVTINVGLKTYEEVKKITDKENKKVTK